MIRENSDISGFCYPFHLYVILVDEFKNVLALAEKQTVIRKIRLVKRILQLIIQIHELESE